MIGKRFQACVAGVAVVGLTAWTSLDAQGAVTYRAVAMSGDAAPGTGVTYSNFSGAVINETGQVAFLGDIVGAGVDSTNKRGIWSEGSGFLDLVARLGAAAPSTSEGVVFSNFGIFSLVINGAGQTTFKSTLAGPGVDDTNDSGIWSGGSGSLGLIARTGDLAPDTAPGVVYSSFGSSFTPVVSNDDDQTAFWGSLTGPGVDSTNSAGIWSEGSGSLGLVARTGDAAPGTELGSVYRDLVAPSINRLGQTAFYAIIAGPSVDSTNEVGLWSEGSGSLVLLAREGEFAVGAEPGVVFKGFGIRPMINRAGQTAFRGFLTGTGVDSTNDNGIWLGESGTLSLVARKGDDAPGAGEGVMIGGTGSPVLNEAGQIVFESLLSGPGVSDTNNRGIWLEDGGSLSLIARTGDAAPGTPEGVVFGRLDNDPVVNPFGPRVLNGVGQLAFVSRLIGPGVDRSNNVGIWVVDPDGTSTLIVRSGDLLDVNDDPLIEDLRTISPLSLGMIGGSAGVDGRHTSFNDAGQLLFRSGFTDGSIGTFVATIPLVGDLNGDRFIDGSDLLLVLLNWNQDVTPDDSLSGDANGDGFIGVDDLSAVLRNWNVGTPPGVEGSVPEPGTLGVLGIGVAWVLRRRG